MTWGAGGIDNKMEVCPLSSEVHPFVHFTTPHLHAWAAIPPLNSHSTNTSCNGALADIVFPLVSQCTRHDILHHTSLDNVSSHVQSTRHSNLNYSTTISIFSSSTRTIKSYPISFYTSMVLTRSRSQQANQNGSGQRNTDKELKPSPNTNGNGHDTRNQHLHPSLQHPAKSQEQETTAHHHPSFQPYCKHSDADGDLHSHALGTFTTI
jgi:hypothetical protein